jgi:hypothetical protein
MRRVVVVDRGGTVVLVRTLAAPLSDILGVAAR